MSESTKAQNIAEEFCEDFLEKSTKDEPTVKVRVNLSALTRMEWSDVIEVPKSLLSQPYWEERLADHFYDEVDESEFTEDNEFWDKGSCYVEEGK